MISHLDERLNAISKAYDDVREADLRGSPALAPLADGLAKSCLLLQDLQHDDLLQNVDAGKYVSEARDFLRNPHMMHRFLEVERALLNVTKVDPKTVGELIEAIKIGAPLLDPVSVKEWKAKVNSLATNVCGEAKRAAGQLRRRSLLRQALVTAGGALVATLNLVPPTLPIPIPPIILHASTGMGVWLIYAGAADFLKGNVFKAAGE
jgi:hypothetical protein